MVEVVIGRNVGGGVLVYLDFLVDVDAVTAAEGGGEWLWRAEGVGRGELEWKG